MTTTINGVTFNMKTLAPVATHRNIPNEEPGSDESFITDMGYSGLVLRMTGYEKTLAKYDEVINEFMKQGAHTLVYRTGWQLSVYSTQLIPLLDAGIVDNWFPYELILLTTTPYRESVSEITRSKTITSNNQEWSADDSANDIDTDGSVDAVPDIQIVGGAVVVTYNRDAGEGHEDIDTTTYAQANTTYVLKKTYTYTADSIRAWTLHTCGLDVRNATNPAYIGYGKVTYTAASLNGGSETDVPSGAWNQTGTTWSADNIVSPDIQAAINEDLVIKFYCKSSTSIGNGEIKNLVSTITSRRKDACKNAQIYNTADPSVKCNIAGEIEPNMIVRVNADGTGAIDYNEDFDDTGYIDAHWDMKNVTRDAVNDELDIADDGFLEYKICSNGPVTGIPTLTSQINITSGIPTIQISSDASTWYDITTAIVDGVDTEYELDSSSLSLKGLTEFYWRIDCVKAAVATCSIKSFELDVDIITIDFEHPAITATGVSTFKCIQDAASGINCVVALYHRDRSWIG